MSVAALGLLSTLVGAAGLVQGIGIRRPQESLYEVGARSKGKKKAQKKVIQVGRPKPKQTLQVGPPNQDMKYMRGAAFVYSGLDMGIGYRELGVLLRELGWGAKDLGGLIEYLIKAEGNGDDGDSSE